jgi:uncharacterized protein YkwD/LysM repeat protein
MKNLILFLLLVCITAANVGAQCPPSNQPGIHVVQEDENLFRIARLYGMSLKRLLTLNNMKDTDVLQACKRLKIDPGKTQPVGVKATAAKPVESSKGAVPQPASPSTPASSIKKQSGNRHLVQPGETVAALAQLYGYTEGRFREFNALGNDQVTPGSIVLSHDCLCDRISVPEQTTPATTESNLTEDISGNYRPNTTTFYDETNPTRISTDHNPVSPQDLGKTNNTSPTPPVPEPTSTASAPDAAAPYMQSLEMDMLREINMLRANPPAYIKYINEYVADQKANNGFPVDQAVVDELNAELAKLGPLSQLQPKECVYIAAKKHGQDIIKMGRTDHIGSDGKWPWDRVRRECPDLQDGNENLVGGPDNVRESVVILLIDEGIPNRGHRKTLLRPDWVYAACYNIGKVGIMPNCWVQKFGF